MSKDEREKKARAEIDAAMERGGADAIILCILNHISDCKDTKTCETYWLSRIVHYAVDLERKS